MRTSPVCDGRARASSKRPLVFLLGLNNRGQMNQGSADMRNEKLWATSSYARFRLKENGPTYEGWPLYFAHGAQSSEIYVSPACRIDEKGAATVLPGPGVLIIEAQLQSVELLDKADSSCRKAVMAIPVAASAAGCAASSRCAASAPSAP